MKGQTPLADLKRFALALPGAWEDSPWGESVAKVGKKVFVFFGHGDEGGVEMSVKLPVSAADALRMPECSPTGYGLGRAGWVSVSYAPGAPAPMDLLREWIEESWASVAPRRLVKAHRGGSGSG